MEYVIMNARINQVTAQEIINTIGCEECMPTSMVTNCDIGDVLNREPRDTIKHKRHPIKKRKKKKRIIRIPDKAIATIAVIKQIIRNCDFNVIRFSFILIIQYEVQCEK